MDEVQMSLTFYRISREKAESIIGSALLNADGPVEVIVNYAEPISKE